MHAIHAPPTVRRPATLLPPRGEIVPASHAPLLTTESFRERVEMEVARHDRYLIGFGLIRIGARLKRGQTGGLPEAISGELRRTDSACGLPDGSFAVLALNSGQRQLRIIVRRLMESAAEIAREGGDEPSDLLAALHAIRDRRVTAPDLWLTVSRAFEQGRGSPERIVLVP